MVTKPRQPAHPAAAPAPEPSDGLPPAPSAMQGPAHNIWLAGLGALASAQANAQAEGSKAFEALVQQGLEMQARTQELAKKQWAEAAQRMGVLQGEAGGAGGSWDRLGGIFEGRVARALASMGMPPACDIAALKDRVQVLEQAIKELRAGQAPVAGKTARRATPRKTRGGA